jgi:hypothetical protein
MNEMSPNLCPSCGSALDSESKFCQQCGLSVASNAPSSVKLVDSSSSVICPKCNTQLNPTATFCWNCGQQIGVTTAATSESKKPIAIILAVCLGVALVYIFLSRNSSNKTTVSSPTTTLERNLSSVINSATQPDPNKLTNAKVEQAVNQLTSNLRVGGNIGVEGIQELPQENAARADLRFANFQYKSDTAGTPVSSDRRAPEKPEINDPNFYDKMYKYGTQQVQTRNYSGQGFAILKHYSDGRWVLKEVHWEFNGWSGNVDIK